MNKALSPSAVIGIVGAGTMGAGITQVAAQAGHSVLLYDSAPGAAARAATSIGKALASLAARGKISAAQADAAAGRIAPIARLTDLAPAALVIEAIVEDMAAKKALFAHLESIVAPGAMLATNTSSFSITALAEGLRNPGRLAGMHFFNPAPIMKLVEIVRGAATDEAVVETLFAVATRWGKTPVRAKSTPGFIVNRVARPFYAEALALYEAAADPAAMPATMDAVMRDMGGFRMGPFELMDLIGHDVNAAVTRAVFEGFGNDPRFASSRTQQDLVAAGWLGRKSGRGFYDYGPGAAPPAPEILSPAPAPACVALEGDFGPAESFAAAIAASGIPCGRKAGAGEGRIIIEGAVLMLTDGRTATGRIADGAPSDLVLFDLALDYGQARRIALAKADRTPVAALAAAAGLVQALGKAATPVADTPGLMVLRTVVRLINEAADAVEAGTADAAAVDTAMRAGANYPRGPLAWAGAIGLERVVAALEALAAAYGEARYRPSPFLRRQAGPRADSVVKKTLP